MKFSFLCAFLLIGIQIAQCQLHDNTWILGYNGNGPEYGTSYLTFTDGTLSIDSVFAKLGFQDNNCSFSTFSGELVAYFDGLRVRDKSYMTMENGAVFNETIIPGQYTLSDDDLPQGSIFLPYPDHPDSVLLLYASEQFLVLSGGLNIVSSDLSSATISITAHNSLGSVLQRSPSLIHDTIQYGELNAVKHANGRDWWILISKKDSRQFYRALLDPGGLHLLENQWVEEPIISGLGAAKFSSDGKHYVVYNGKNFGSDGSLLDIFDFDRCTGQLSNQRHYVMQGAIGGIEISASSRYLYQGLGDTVFQYDLSQQDIWSTRTIVALYDGFTDPFPVKFYQFQLAPDDKIYISATNSTQYLHVIEQPDAAAPDCGFRQHGVKLLKHFYASLPNHPHYRLGPVDGSACDTLGIDNLPRAWYRYEPDTLDPWSVNFHDLSYYEPAAWNWNFGDASANSTARNPSHTFNGPGAYCVCLTASNGYGTDVHCKTLYLGVSATENPVVQPITISPNPFREQLIISLDTQSRERVFRLYDRLGRLVLRQSIQLGPAEINPAGIPAGLYYWVISGQQEPIKTGTIVKLAE